MKSKVIIEIDDNIMPVQMLDDGLFYTELYTKYDQHYIKIIQDNILYHKKCYLHLLNPIKCIRSIFFLKNFLYSTCYNSESDVFLLKIRLQNKVSEIKFELLPKQMNNNYTQYYDSFTCSSHDGISILNKSHCDPPKRFFINCCIVNFTYPILTMIILWYVLLAVNFNFELLIILLIYTIYALINIITEIRHRKI